MITIIFKNYCYHIIFVFLTSLSYSTMMLTVLNDFFIFLRNPVLLRNPIKKAPTHVVVVLFLLSIPLTFFLGYIDHIECIKIFFGIVQDNMLKDLLEHGLIYGIIIVAIVTPLIEEYIFRYYLNNFYGNVFYFFINISIVFYNFFSLRNKNISIISFSFVIIGLFFFILICNNEKIKIAVNKLMDNHFGFIFYLSAIAFGLMHLSNYKFDKNILFLPIVLVLAQILAGIFLGYIRLNCGIKYSILFHFFNNFFFLLFLFL